MATQVQIRRGTTAQHAAFTGAAGEVTVDTDKGTVVIHNGSTAGGFPALREDASNSALALGSAGTPSLKFTGDTNTGIYSPGADQVAISTGGSGRVFIGSTGTVNFTGGGTAGSTQAVSFNGSAPVNSLVIDSSGRLGVGTSSPTDRLSVNATAANTFAANFFGPIGNNECVLVGLSDEVTTRKTGIGFQRLDGFRRGNFFIFNNNDANESTSGGINDARLTVTSAGLVGIGTSSPTQNLTVTDVVSVKSTPMGSSQVLFSDSDSDFAGRLFYNHTTDALQFFVNAAERARIDSSGRLGIGVTTVDEKLHVSGGNIKQQLAAATNGGFFINNGTNDLIAIGSGGFAANGGSVTDGGIRAANNLVFATGSGTPERGRFDSSGRLLVGTSTARSNFFNTPIVSSLVNVEVAADNQIEFAGIRNRNNTEGALIALAKSRGTTAGSNTVVVSGDELGRVSFQGSDGTEFVEGAFIQAQVDATPGANNMPGRLVFSTTADGAASPTERARITNAGFFKASNTGSYRNANDTYFEFLSDKQTSVVCHGTATHASFQESILYLNAHRAATSSYAFLDTKSGNDADREHYLRGDGNAFADGTWIGGGADYAEYFEWSDSNTNEEDRRGISVILDGDKIREAVAGEDPIGVISGNPSVVGDAAWNKWSGKYLRDEFGTYILEDYEVEDEDGNTVVQQRRKLNPAYDSDQEYISREQRPEWDCVGLMGKLRIRKGQITGSRWIKMRDISDTVEEWLVR